MRKTAGGMIEAMRLIRAPHAMNGRPEKAVTETGASTETVETPGMTANTATVMRKMCEIPENDRQWNTERETETGKGSESERGTGKGTMFTGKMTHQYRTKEAMEEDTEEKRGGVRAGWRAGTNHVQRGWEEEGDVHRTTLRKVRNDSAY